MDFAEVYGAFQQFPSGTGVQEVTLLQPTWDKPLWGEQTRITNQLLIRLSGMILQVAQTFKGLKRMLKPWVLNLHQGLSMLSVVHGQIQWINPPRLHVWVFPEKNIIPRNN